MALNRFRLRFSRNISFIDVGLVVLLVFFAYALTSVAQEWAGPYRPRTEISLTYPALLGYSFFSLIRVTAAYVLSLIFTFTYGYAAAKTKIGEPILIPILDILQSVPVLGFMPGLVLALVGLFPHSNFGLELAAIVMIFTGEGWNMVFSFYTSLKNVPPDFRELGQMSRFNRIEMLRHIELPYSANGLLWNSMLSMAGGWFFLMTIESFSLGDKDFRLPGIGSYMAVAYENNDYAAIVAGIVAMFTLIIIVDRIVWAPLVVWSERFRAERDPTRTAGRSVVLDWIRRSDLIANWTELFEERVLKPLQKSASKKKKTDPLYKIAKWGRAGMKPGITFLLFVVGMVLAIGGRGAYLLLSQTPVATWLWLAWETFLTFLRVSVAVVIGSLWTIPLGVFIGTKPKWTRRLQPVVQAVASFPAPMVFPILTFVFLKLGISIEIGSVLLLLFACQWYILFNVISGATVIPKSLMEVGEVFQLKGWPYWKAIILPAIFPSLVNGWITAAGGAWNATIVSEFVLYKGNSYSATGIGAAITRAAQAGDYPTLTAAVVMMVTAVVLLNRVFWNNLYKLAETRFRID